MLSIIVAVAENNVIGSNNSMPWHLPEDLKRFKEITMNNTIIMGRKTFESLPKILPGRQHIVLTKDKDYTVDSDQVTIVHDLNEIIEKYSNSEEEAFIIGGGKIYDLTYPYCNKLYLTKVKSLFKGDTYFPDINFHDWKVIYSSGEKINPEDKIEYEHIDLERTK